VKEERGERAGPLAVVVVSFFESVVRDHSKDHSGDRAYLSPDPPIGDGVGRVKTRECPCGAAGLDLSRV
jgi:hypothetical protein